MTNGTSGASGGGVQRYEAYSEYADRDAHVNHIAEDDGDWVRYTDHFAAMADKDAQLAQCFKLAGADCEGNEDWRIAPRAVRAVADLRRDYDEACDEMHQLGRDAGNTEAALRKQLGEWLVANAPGGWIDELRKRAESAEAKLVAVGGLAKVAALAAARQASAKGGASDD